MLPHLLVDRDKKGRVSTWFLATGKLVWFESSDGIYHVSERGGSDLMNFFFRDEMEDG